MDFFFKNLINGTDGLNYIILAINSLLVLNLYLARNSNKKILTEVSKNINDIKETLNIDSIKCMKNIAWNQGQLQATSAQVIADVSEKMEKLVGLIQELRDQMTSYETETKLSFEETEASLDGTKESLEATSEATSTEIFQVRGLSLNSNKNDINIISKLSQIDKYIVEIKGEIKKVFDSHKIDKIIESAESSQQLQQSQLEGIKKLSDSIDLIKDLFDLSDINEIKNLLTNSTGTNAKFLESQTANDYKIKQMSDKIDEVLKKLNGPFKLNGSDSKNVMNEVIQKIDEIKEKINNMGTAIYPYPNVTGISEDYIKDKENIQTGKIFLNSEEINKERCNGDRVITKTIRFGKIKNYLTTNPKIICELKRIDSDCAANLRFQTNVENVTKEGFTFTFHTWGDTFITSIEFGWTASI